MSADLATVILHARDNDISAKAASEVRMSSSGDTRSTAVLLNGIRAGDPSAENALFDRIYHDLKKLARWNLQRAPDDKSLTPSDLVQEAVSRLLKRERRATANDRVHLVALASQAMRHVLADRAKKRGAAKRRTGWQGEAEDVQNLGEPGRVWSPEDLLALESAIAGLELKHPQWAKVVVLRFIGGLTVKEIAAELHLGESTVKLALHQGRQWLWCKLNGEERE